MTTDDLDRAPTPPHRHGVLIPLAEDLVEQIGEDAAWQIARQQADRKAARYAIGTMHRIAEETFTIDEPPTIDPDAGRELAPMRARGYRFTYTDDGGDR